MCFQEIIKLDLGPSHLAGPDLGKSSKLSSGPSLLARTRVGPWISRTETKSNTNGTRCEVTHLEHIGMTKQQLEHLTRPAAAMYDKLYD